MSYVILQKQKKWFHYNGKEILDTTKNIQITVGRVIMIDYKNLFLRQSYLDAYEEYKRSLIKCHLNYWDYIILTASNEFQAKIYEEQIQFRLKQGYLPEYTHYAVLPDPDGKRVGSGGATLNVMKYIKEHSGKDSFDGMRILVIHSGGDSKRIPQYSACGKLFSPVPRELPDGRRSTLFDEFIISMTGVPARINYGMLVCSGDVLLLFNPLQLDFYTKGAVALSIKENVETGKNHGVFLSDDEGFVRMFLHKQSVNTLTDIGAVDEVQNVNIDTGAVIFDSNILNSLWTLIDTNNKFHKFVNDQVRLSFYGDFLYPLASDSSLEKYYHETPEGEFSTALAECRESLWEVLHPYQMKMICFSPASFIHFGTSKELLQLVTEDIDSYQFLDWSPHVNTNTHNPTYAASNSFISTHNVSVGQGSYIEDSIVLSETTIGDGCIISGVTLEGQRIPNHTVLHGIKLNNGKFVVRIYDVEDNPKTDIWLGNQLSGPLWSAKLFVPCVTMKEAVDVALSIRNNSTNSVACEDMVHGMSIAYGEVAYAKEDAREWREDEFISLQESFGEADGSQILLWQQKVGDRVKVERFIEAIETRMSVTDAKAYFINGFSKRVSNSLGEIAKNSQFSRKIRIYYYLSKICGLEQKKYFEDLCFDTICQETLKNTFHGKQIFSKENRINQDHVIVKCPVRVNFGGGWSDTPPYCNEHGGTVLNAAIAIDGRYPIEVQIQRIDEYKIILSSADFGSYKEFDSLRELQDCRSPHDPYALHKAALVACGIIPYEGEAVSLVQILQRLGGGFSLSTQVIDIPRGSGLGTSSILAGACVKAIFQFLGQELSEDDLYGRTLCLEQIMSTGGGWQDQVGGLTKGIKMITSVPGLNQKIKCMSLHISETTLNELQNRFCIIYTGQRRLARNLLREVVGKYIGNEKENIDMLYEIQRLAVLMRFELEKGDIETFAKLLSQHWELSKRLDQGCTNTCIDLILVACDDLIVGKMICGAGGGGFLQVVLKSGIAIEVLKERLNSVFAGSGVSVWQCEFV